LEHGRLKWGLGDDQSEVRRASLGQSSIDSRTPSEEVIDRCIRLRTLSSAVALEPPTLPEAVEIDTWRRIPTTGAVTGSKLERDLFVAKRNA
jgi:hypothetical protein